MFETSSVNHNLEPMLFSAAQIAMLVNGKVEGDPASSVNSFGKIEEAKNGQLAFLANPKYEEYLYTTNASVIILGEAHTLKQPVKGTIVRVQDAYSAFALLLEKYQQMMTQQLTGIQQPCYISETASIGADVFVGAFTCIGEKVKVGNNVKIYPNVFIC